MNFIEPLEKDIQFGLRSKTLSTEGNLIWEYNPFRNYRLSEPKYYFRNKFFNQEELEKELGEIIPSQIIEETPNDIWEDYRDTKRSNGIHSYEDDPILYDTNQLVDFETDELNFDINHPVDVLPQYSYDGSVNLILNDGKNPPRLINSRFSPLGKNRYQIVDRKGDNDTNIYDQGVQFESDTSLYKTYVGIPELLFVGVKQEGNLLVGNYHFYFKYVDADGNETDFVAESGLVSIFKGVIFGNAHTGFRNENAYKSVQFLLSNIDPSYQYIVVYYTRNTSDINESKTTSAHKINQKYLVNNSLVCNIRITGDEDTSEISVDEINTSYQIAESVHTQEQCQNMLFLGNITNKTLPYKELTDLSLRFKAKPKIKEYKLVDHTYNSKVKDTYLDPNFIYNYTGYTNNEIYRLGIVYLMSDGTLSPVFNIRGAFSDTEYTEFLIYSEDSTGNKVRNYITFNESTGIIYSDTDSGRVNKSLENVYGVVRFNLKEIKSEVESIIGIEIVLEDEHVLFNELKKHKVKGYFFVRQKRIPLRLCQALTIGIDPQSHTPLLYTNSDTSIKSSTKPKEGESGFITERFLNDKQILDHEVDNHLYWVNSDRINYYGAICPEYDINSPYYNSLFNGNEFIIKESSPQAPLMQDSIEHRHFYYDKYRTPSDTSLTVSKIVGVEDNVKLIEVNRKLYSARAGEAEEAFRYEYINEEVVNTKSTNLLRGSYGPYLAISNYNIPGNIIDIYINDYKQASDEDLLKIRVNDKSPYYAISDRYSIIDGPKKDIVLYRGDTYICTFTHRFNRNFQDPSTPINDKIVDEKCWKDHYKVTDGVVKKENFEKINLGDVNAVKLGLWVTFSLVSSYNLNLRSLDDSNADEVALTGHCRGFFPYYGMKCNGSYKIPEALCTNKGFTTTLSERVNFEVPDVPAIKNDFTNRIAYSDIHVNDAFKNGFRTFRFNHYRDYPKTYGQIIKLVELRGNLICVFEHGIALIPVNERAVAGEGSGGNIFINTSNVLPENPKIISDTFGSQWKDSVIKTQFGVYGVDTIGKKIWRTDGTNFECISDFRVQEFLNNNVSLSERELEPIIGVRNVKTHYNKFKGDIMFTFYDNLYGFEEKVWNLCFNELINKWVTFYSWVPSYSENIYNQFFSFDRNTSKLISKLGVSKTGNDFSDGITISDNIIKNNAEFKMHLVQIPYDPPNNPPSIGAIKVGELTLSNRNLPTGDNITYDISYELLQDNFNNYKNFKIYKDAKGKWCLYLTKEIQYICSEFYERGTKSNNIYTTVIDKPGVDNEDWVNNCIKGNKYTICKDNNGRKKQLPYEDQVNPNKIVTFLNIRATITPIYPSKNNSLVEAYQNSFKNESIVNGGYYESVVAIIPEYNLQFLTTDFWKHGQAGIIDIADKIQPTYWYGKQHPFEFEFIVVDNPQVHKIFDNLEIISNNAEPESFHYEIIGDCFDFAKDKKNMYIRQEATKALYQANDLDIIYDPNYKTLESKQRPLHRSDGEEIPNVYEKSTLLPLYYSRQDTINEIEDYYHLKDGTPTKDFSALAGGEIVRYKTLDEYRIWNHSKAVNLSSKGRMRGNMAYFEDRWRVQINPINLIQKNEPKWKNGKVPIELGQSPIPEKVLDYAEDHNKLLTIPEPERDIVVWKWEESDMKEVKMKDKWIKIRIRYEGKKLAIISAIKTLYSISYS